MNVYDAHIFFEAGFRMHVASGSGEQNSAIHLECGRLNGVAGRTAIG